MKSLHRSTVRWLGRRESLRREGLAADGYWGTARGRVRLFMGRYRDNPQAIRALVRPGSLHRDLYIDPELFEVSGDAGPPDVLGRLPGSASFVLESRLD